MAYKFLRTLNGTILMYQSGDMIGPGSSHAMLISVSAEDWQSNTGTSSRIYNLDNGAYIEAIRTIALDGSTTLTARFYNSGGERLTEYSQSVTGGGLELRGGHAICMQWFEHDNDIKIGFNYFTFGSGVPYTANTAFAPGAWLTVSSNTSMYSNPTSVYVGSDVYGNAVVDNPGNPYDVNGNTEPGGGGGIGYDNMPNDPIDFPDALSITASNANFISIWTPTLDQVQSLAAWIWTTDPVKVAFWQKLLQNPLELIFSLAILPVPIHHTDDPSEPVEEEIAHIDSLALGWQNTGLLMDWIDKQYVTVDMGTIEMEEVWGAFLDYEPYTKIDIFLPYIGTKHLDTNDCMPRNISLKYIIDLATGTCLALIKCDDSVYYHFSGNCASQIPITVNQCQEIVRGLITMAVGAATFAVGGAVGAGAHASKAAITKGAAMKAGGAAMVGSGADNAAKGVNVSRSGTISCAAGLMDVQTPYLIISRPKQAMPEEQNKYTGYPSFITRELSELEGYTEVQIIHLENIPCTENEMQEIDELLVSGVIL